MTDRVMADHGTRPPPAAPRELARPYAGRRAVEEHEAVPAVVSVAAAAMRFADAALGLNMHWFHGDRRMRKSKPWVRDEGCLLEEWSIRSLDIKHLQTLDEALALLPEHSQMDLDLWNAIALELRRFGHGSKIGEVYPRLTVSWED